MLARRPRVSSWIVVALLTVTVLAPGPMVDAATVKARSAHVDASRSVSDCLTGLDCDAEEIDAMTMADRLAFVRGLQARHASLLVAGFNKWRNIEGVLEFFRDRQIGAQGTWMSYVDAGILEAIERGTAIARGLSTDDFGNPGAKLWASYLDRLRHGELVERSAHDRAWSTAEQAATDHAVDLAQAHGAETTAVERRFFLFSQFYRWVLRNEPPTVTLIAIFESDMDKEIFALRVPFVSWLTDVTDDVPTRKGGEVVYDVANVDPVSTTVSIVDLLLAYLPELFRQFRAQVVVRMGGANFVPGG